MSICGAEIPGQQGRLVRTAAGVADLNWLALAIGAPLALVFTLAVRTLAARRGWMDRPGAARIHAVPVPRLGGVAMYAAFVITVLVVAWPLDRQTLGLLLGATLLVVFIVVDDLRRDASARQVPSPTCGRSGAAAVWRAYRCDQQSLRGPVWCCCTRRS